MVTAFFSSSVNWRLLTKLPSYFHQSNAYIAMEIGKLLNPKAGTGPGQAEDKGKEAGSAKVPDVSKKSGADDGQKDWEDKMKSKGMPTQGLNTFRVKKQG